MKAYADRDLCVGGGLCVVAAPAIFDQDEDEGLVLVLAETVAVDQEEHARQAADQCPARAIQLVDN